MDKIEKDVNALTRIAEALLERVEGLERELGIQKDRKPAGESLGTSAARVLKATEQKKLPYGLDFDAANKSRLAKARGEKPAAVEGPLAAVSRKHRGQ
jgi:hypothetical protein